MSGVRWRFLDPDGSTVGGSPPFADRQAAEAWLAGAWEDLVEDDVEAVELWDDHAPAYRMSLRPTPEDLPGRTVP